MGHRTFVQDFNIRLGQSFLDRMRQGFDEADHILALFFKCFSKQESTLSEINSALSGDALGRAIRTISCCLDPALFVSSAACVSGSTSARVG